ncbi:MAG TPA: protoporphyrinogen oxidase [Solirubrobacteraceae bacterium]|nr:protoporphyrinogen oxidase [Solirubrobacteraceae bacterium]
MNGAPHIAIVGGGITGLAAARQLTRMRIGGEFPRLTVIEAEHRLGGKIRSQGFAGTTVDLGPEALLTAVPAAVRLCHDLGLEDELVAPLQSRTAVWTRGQLRELPPGILGGLPDGIGPIVRSGILSPIGAARAGIDLMLPAGGRGDADESVGSLVRRRLGSEALERMIDPLLGGIYGGDSDRLSLRATAPRLDALAREHRSLIRGLMAAGRSTPVASAGPAFMTLPGGLQRLVTGLQRELGRTELISGEHVRRVTSQADGRYALRTDTGRELVVDAAILAVPAYAAQEMLGQSAPAAAAELAGIEYTSVAIVWLAFRAAAVPRLPDRSGFLVPRGEGRTLSACTWASSKWPHLATRPDRVLLRCSVGRGRPEAIGLDQHTLVTDVTADLRAAIGVREPPAEWHVARWERAMPQYHVGHLERVQRLELALGHLPRIRLAGAAYHGMGVPQCIAQGEQAATQIATALRP